MRARKGRRLCEHGFHHWELDAHSAHHAPGRKDLLWRCARCAATCVGPTPGTPAGTPPPAPQEPPTPRDRGADD